MGKNEIKLRQRLLNPADILRYHDYPALMKRHERSKRLKRAVRFFTFSVIVTIIVLLFLMIISYLWFGVGRKSEPMKKEKQNAITQLAKYSLFSAPTLRRASAIRSVGEVVDCR